MKSVAEVLNYKQKGKDMDEFIVVPLSEKLAYCFGDPGTYVDVYHDLNASDLFLHERSWNIGRSSWNDYADFPCIRWFLGRTYGNHH